MILPTRSHWQYSSSNPAEGTYIAEEEAEREGFLAALQSQLKDAPSAAGKSIDEGEMSMGLEGILSMLVI
jgi:hypothetical protein